MYVSEKQHVKIVYFSGTGGTERGALLLEQTMKQAGWETTLYRIRAGEKDPEVAETLLVLLYPVYAFHEPKPVSDWIAQLRPTSGKPAAVLSVSGGGDVSPNTACRVRAIRGLEAKGHRIVYEEMLVMPSNIGIQTKEPMASMLLHMLPTKIDKIASDLISGKEHRKNPNLPDRFFALVGRGERWGARAFGSRIQVSSACTGCGKCAASCTSGNIQMRAGRPVFGGKCNLCMACLYGCPVHALEPGIGKFVVLKDGYHLKALETPGMFPVPENLNRLRGGILWGGVVKYLRSMGNQQ